MKLKLNLYDVGGAKVLVRTTTKTLEIESKQSIAINEVFDVDSEEEYTCAMYDYDINIISVEAQ